MARYRQLTISNNLYVSYRVRSWQCVLIRSRCHLSGMYDSVFVSIIHESKGQRKSALLNNYNTGKKTNDVVNAWNNLLLGTRYVYMHSKAYKRESSDLTFLLSQKRGAERKNSLEWYFSVARYPSVTYVEKL